MSELMKSFSSLADVPVNYAREPIAPYGTKGKPHTFRCMDGFLIKLESAFDELWRVCPLGRAEVITSAGAFVQKPGFHGKGRAFDLDAIFWPDREFVTLRFPTDQRFYIGVEAVMRKHFGTVLNYLYNPDHRDHLHLDDGSEVGFVTSSRSRVLFIQASLTYVADVPVNIDGNYGPQTESAIRAAFEKLGVAGDIHSRDVWLEFLTRIAEESFKTNQASRIEDHTPLGLLRNLYSVIGHELEGKPARKIVETALSAFVEHEETSEWLNKHGVDNPERKGESAMFEHNFGNAGKRTVRMHVGAVTVSLTDNEYLHYKLTVQGAEPVFDFACMHRTLLKDKDFPGHPKQVYEWDWGKKPGDSDTDDDVYVVAMFFIDAVKYTLLVEHRRSDNSVKETVIDADYASQNSEDKYREILSVFTS